MCEAFQVKLPTAWAGSWPFSQTEYEMTKSDGVSFEDWFDSLRIHVLDRTGIEFRDADAVREDYDDGKDMHDVADEIAAEYADPD